MWLGLSQESCRADDDRLDRNIAAVAFGRGFDVPDLVDDIQAFHNLTKHTVTPATQGFAAMVEKRIALHVDEELRTACIRS